MKNILLLWLAVSAPASHAMRPVFVRKICEHWLSSRTAPIENAREFSGLLSAALALVPEEITLSTLPKPHLVLGREDGFSRWQMHQPASEKLIEEGLALIEAAEPLAAEDLDPAGASLGRDGVLRLVFFSKLHGDPAWARAKLMQFHLNFAIARAAEGLKLRSVPQNWIQVDLAGETDKPYLRAKIQIQTDLDNRTYLRMLTRIFTELDRRWVHLTPR